MSLSTQFRNLATRSAAMRQDIFGVNSDGEQILANLEDADGTRSDPFPCYFSPVRSTEQLDLAGFKDIHDTIVRVSKSEAVIPSIGKLLRLIKANADGTDIVVRISEMAPNSLNPEWVLGCKNSF